MLRRLLKDPAYATAAVVTLALAIGAIFSAVRAILLNPLPIDGPQDVVVVWESDRARGLGVVPYAVVVVVVAGAVILTSCVPARRAAAADPLPLLREE